MYGHIAENRLRSSECFMSHLLVAIFVEGIEGFVSVEEQETFNRIEQQLKKRFALGTFVSEYLILQDFVRQNYAEVMVKKVGFVWSS